MLLRRHDTAGCTALGSVAAQSHELKEKPPPLGCVPRGAASKDAGVGPPQDAGNGSCGPFIPFQKAREDQQAWHRPGENTSEWRRSLSFSSSTTMHAESEPRSTSRRIAYRGEAEEAAPLVAAECHFDHKSNMSHPEF